MTITHDTLRKLSSRLMRENARFKDLHKGESCYLFGNGSSLKYFDLEAFRDRPSIGCGALFSHRHVNALNLKYYFIGHPFFFYQFWKNPYSKSYERNRVGVFYRRHIDQHKETEFFTSLSNCFGIRGRNINYIYHFGQLDRLNLDIDLAGVNPMMEGSMLGMLGLALFMGYTDITLVGCDYTFEPTMHGHFYEQGIPKTSQRPPYLKQTFELIQQRATIRTIVPDSQFDSAVLPSVTYSEFSGMQPQFKDNLEIVSKENLQDFDSQNMEYRIFNS